MDKRTLGRTGIACSEVGLGTWAFASQIYGDVPERDADDTIRFAIDHGINLFDTAPLYGSQTEDGISETILGKALAPVLSNKRDEVVVSTKFGRYATDKAAPNFHAQRARESVEGSLRRLGTDHIDILFFHSPFSPDEINDDVWEELDRLKNEGKVRVIGHSISMFEKTEQMARDWADQRRIDVVQVVYSLMNRQSSDLIRDLGHQGVGVFARESLANGFLAEGMTSEVVFENNNINKRYTRDEIQERVEYSQSLRFLVREDVGTLPEAAVRWVLDTKSVSAVLSGAKNTAELRDWIAGASAQSFTPAEMQHAASAHYRDFQAA